MELFEPVLGMTMIAVGLIMLMGGVGLLFYLIWTNGKKTARVGSAVEPLVDGEQL